MIMPQVGIRELKNDASEIIRAVREEQAEYVVTLRGRPVAMILPMAEGWQAAATERAVATTRANADFWDRMAVLGAEIAAKWQSDKTAVELIEEQRR
jgi:prevent-host-death family protein